MGHKHKSYRAERIYTKFVNDVLLDEEQNFLDERRSELTEEVIEYSDPSLDWAARSHLRKDCEKMPLAQLESLAARLLEESRERGFQRYEKEEDDRIFGDRISPLSYFDDDNCDDMGY